MEKKKKRTEYTITKWKIHGTSYSFLNAKDMLAKYDEISKDLKSDEKLDVTRTEIEEFEYVVPPPTKQDK